MTFTAEPWRDAPDAALRRQELLRDYRHRRLWAIYPIYFSTELARRTSDHLRRILADEMAGIALNTLSLQDRLDGAEAPKVEDNDFALRPVRSELLFVCRKDCLDACERVVRHIETAVIGETNPCRVLPCANLSRVRDEKHGQHRPTVRVLREQ